jgi:hypothetical protein
MNCGFPEYSSSGLHALIRDAFIELAKRRYDYALALQRYELHDILADEMRLRETWEGATREEADPYSVVNGGKGLGR